MEEEVREVAGEVREVEEDEGVEMIPWAGSMQQMYSLARQLWAASQTPS